MFEHPQAHGAEPPGPGQHAEDRAQIVQNRIADTITRFAGSMMFVYVHVIWFGAWIIFKVEHYWAAIDGFWPIIAAGDHSDQGPGPDGRSVVV